MSSPPAGRPSDATQNADRPRSSPWLLWFLAAAVTVGCATVVTTRSSWGYRPLPKIKGTDIVVPRHWQPDESPRNWNWIVVHHSASDSGGAAVFDSWHRKRGFDELGYHFVIDNGSGQPDGNVEIGSRWLKQKQGAHAKSDTGVYNDRGIGICLVGNFEKDPPTPKQWEMLVKLAAYLSANFDIPPERIIGHQDVANKTLCPGKNLSVDKLRDDVKQYLRDHRK